MRPFALTLAAALSATAAVAVAQPAAAPAPTDPQIAHIAYNAGLIDIAAARQALARSHNTQVRAFAQQMIRDHMAVNNQALALCHRLHVTPEANATSTAMSQQAASKLRDLSHLTGAAYDRAYVANEVAYHQAVNHALETLLIPSAHNADLKALLNTGLTLFREHQHHAEMLAAALH
jgi:putative membrane protein